MNLFSFVFLLFIGASHVRSDEGHHLLNLNGLVSSVGALVNNTSSLLDDPSGSLGGALEVVPASIRVAISLQNTVNSLNNLTSSISNSSDGSIINYLLEQNIDDIINGLNDLAKAAYKISRGVANQTDGSGNVNLLYLIYVDGGLNDLADAQEEFPPAISEVSSGKSGDGPADVDELCSAIEAAADSHFNLTTAVYNLQGVSGAAFGLVNVVTGVVRNIQKISKALYDLADALESQLSKLDSSTASIVKVIIQYLRRLAKAEGVLAEAALSLLSL